VRRNLILSQQFDADTFFIGCAGWNVPKLFAGHFPPAGSHLERYASRFSGVEINSSFYRPHRPQTYEKWAASVPPQFRFSVKVPKVITHEKRLVDTREPLNRFLDEVAKLGSKLGPLLVQLPPSLAYDQVKATDFFGGLREMFKGQVVCEPRHATWFAPDANVLLTAFQVARVAADPALLPQAFEPGGWRGLVYYRLHGSPTIYRSAYSTEFLKRLSVSLQIQTERSLPSWCIFDNTAEGAATGNALELAYRGEMANSLGADFYAEVIK
jgi:uncharacterized protein YecE (DUF72 family)